MSFAPVTVYALLTPADGTNSIIISSDPGQFEGTNFVGNVTLGVLDKTKWKLSISLQYTHSIFINSSEPIAFSKQLKILEILTALPYR